MQIFAYIPDAKSWLIRKDCDAGRDWGQEEKGTTEDEMAGWHHWLDGRESEWTPGVGDGQGGLACCDSWGRKESDTTEQLKWTVIRHDSIFQILHPSGEIQCPITKQHQTTKIRKWRKKRPKEISSSKIKGKIWRWRWKARIYMKRQTRSQDPWIWS